MGKEQESAFYDDRLERVSLPLEESPWQDVYNEVAKRLPSPGIGPSIADVGCGTGRLAKLLEKRGYTRY
jgi:SAM-dependent methyltransferase